MTLKLNILAQFNKLNVKVRYFPYICAKNNISKMRMLGFYVAKTNYEKYARTRQLKYCGSVPGIDCNR